MPRHTFRDLSTVVDDVHALVDTWAASGVLSDSPDDAEGTGLDADGVEVLRLVIHEWVANLVQHATFTGPVEISVAVERVADGVACEVTDSSVGFDFAAQIVHQQAVLDAPGPSERGRGLLMLVTCTRQLSFEPSRPGRRQRIAFHVPPANAMPLMAGLFSADDLLSEELLPDDLLPDDLNAGDSFADAPFDGPFDDGAFAEGSPVDAAPVPLPFLSPPRADGAARPPAAR